MLKLHVSEKGGASRDLLLDKSVVSIGRSPKNDIILPRNNVSKKHAAIEVVDRACVVSDMGSTNGTIVGGRRIAKPTVVPPGEKIVISDFIITFVELVDRHPEGVPSTPPSTRGGSSSPGLSQSAIREYLDVLRPSDEPPEPVLAERVTPPLAIGEEEEGDAAREAGPARRGGGEAPGAPPAPAAAGEGGDAATAAGLRRLLAEMYAEVETILSLERAAPEAIEGREFEEKARTVVGQVVDACRRSGQVPPVVEREVLVMLLGAEVIGLGPIDDYLGDGWVREIRIYPSGEVVLAGGDVMKTLSDPFISARSRAIILRRLQWRAGGAAQPGRATVTGSIGEGIDVKMMLPPLSPAGVFATIEKSAAPAPPTIARLVGEGTLSQPMAGLLSLCVQEGRGLLVADPHGQGGAALMQGLAAEIAAGGRVAVFSSDPRAPLHVPGAHGFVLPADLEGEGRRAAGAEELSLIAASLKPTVVLVDDVRSLTVLRFIRVCAASRVAVVARVREPGPVECVERLRRLVLDEYGAADAASALLLAVEPFAMIASCARLVDGKDRVALVGEVEAGAGGTYEVKAVFSFEVAQVGPGGSVRGGFAPSGRIPRFIEELRRAGEPVDVSIFAREQ